MAGEKYRVQLTALAENLNPKNRLYFDRLYDTLLLNGAIYNSEVVSELAYDVLLDLLDAQADGIGAESYFGLSAIQMSKKLLKQVDKKTKSLRNLTIWTVLIGLFWNYAVNISWFGIEPTPISWVCYLFEIILLSSGVFLLFKVFWFSLLVKSKRLSVIILWGYIFIVLSVFVWGQILLRDFQAFYISSFSSKIICLVLFLVYVLCAIKFIKSTANKL
ncbi:MAG: DUF1129 domain-containing protein [Lactococcus sp.]|jgi:hypothetical protein